MLQIIHDLSPLINSLNTLLVFAILFFAMLISTTSTIQRMVSYYRLQAVGLAVIVVLTVATAPPFNGALASIAALPIMMAFLVPPLLARATIVAPAARTTAPSRRVRAVLRDLSGAERSAQRVWLQYGRSRLLPTMTVAVDLLLTIFGFVVAYQLITRTPSAVQSHFTKNSPEINSLAVGLSMLLIGIFTMINRRDIISQIIGLLVMEHGLFLVVVKVIVQPALTVAFVGSLFFYVLITLLILVWLLPELHRVSHSIDLDDQCELKG